MHKSVKQYDYSKLMTRKKSTVAEIKVPLWTSLVNDSVDQYGKESPHYEKKQKE